MSATSWTHQRAKVTLLSRTRVHRNHLDRIANHGIEQPVRPAEPPPAPQPNKHTPKKQ